MYLNSILIVFVLSHLDPWFLTISFHMNCIQSGHVHKTSSFCKERHTIRHAAWQHVSEKTNHAALELFTGDAAWSIVKRTPRNNSMVHLSLLSFEPFEPWALSAQPHPWHKVPMHCKNDQCQCQCQCLCLYTSMISGFKTQYHWKIYPWTQGPSCLLPQWRLAWQLYDMLWFNVT